VQAFEIVQYGPSVLFVGGELDMATCPNSIEPCQMRRVGRSGCRGSVGGQLHRLDGDSPWRTARRDYAQAVLPYTASAARLPRCLAWLASRASRTSTSSRARRIGTPIGSARLDGRTSADVAARLQSLRTMFDRHRD
jgi:hypothetical protein